jgi:hypothetical protein
MLKPQVAGHRHWRRGLGVIAAAICGNAVFAAWLWLSPARSPLVIVTPAVVPPAQVRVEVLPAPPPRALPAAPPLPPPAAPAPVVGMRCVEDPSTIGVPVDQPAVGPAVIGAQVSREGCTIAAWTEHAVFLSWDGGQTFASFEIAGAFQIAVTSEHAVLVRDRALGSVRPGDRAITWREIPGLAPRDGETAAEARLAGNLVAGGRWAVIVVGKLVMASDDDGATWRYLTLPADNFVLSDLDAEGRLTATAIVPVRQGSSEEMDMGGPQEVETRRFEIRILGGRWRALPALPGRLAAATGAWSYVQDSDEFWGCGGSSKIVALRGGHSELIAGGLRDENYHVSLAANAEVAFAGYGAELHRLAGTHNQVVAALPDTDPRLVAVDSRAMPLAIGGSSLLRWSPRGGWRRLLITP